MNNSESVAARIIIDWSGIVIVVTEFNLGVCLTINERNRINMTSTVGKLDAQVFPFLWKNQGKNSEQ
jgi:hypothetical protein